MTIPTSLNEAQCPDCGGGIVKDDRTNNDDDGWKYWVSCENHPKHDDSRHMSTWGREDGDCIHTAIVVYNQEGELVGSHGGLQTEGDEPRSV